MTKAPHATHGTRDLRSQAHFPILLFGTLSLVLLLPACGASSFFKAATRAADRIEQVAKETKAGIEENRAEMRKMWPLVLAGAGALVATGGKTAWRFAHRGRKS